MNKHQYVSAKALQEMPPGKFLGMRVVKDMDMEDHWAVIWWSMPGCPHPASKQAFDAETGEYLGEQ